MLEVYFGLCTMGRRTTHQHTNAQHSTTRHIAQWCALYRATFVPSILATSSFVQKQQTVCSNQPDATSCKVFQQLIEFNFSISHCIGINKQNLMTCEERHCQGICKLKQIFGLIRVLMKYTTAEWRSRGRPRSLSIYSTVNRFSIVT